MKCSFLLIFVSLLQLSANAFSQSAPVQLDVNKSYTVKELFQTIEDNTPYRFFYSSDLTDLNKTISVKQQNIPVNDLLNFILAESAVSYTMLENNMIVVAPKGILRQGITVTGIVVDNNGEPLPGVNVTVKGTLTGVVTDFNGGYSITVPNEDAELVFSFVGYSKVETLVGNQRVISPVLAETVTELDELVVVGYGTVRKKDLTGSVVSMTSKDIFPSGSPGGFSWQGKLSGLNITSQDGRPNATTTMLIRGGTSISQSNAPLVIVDGLPGGIPSAAYIERIDVLKDASSTAIYGARGANGVIVVTTKGPKEKFSVTYDGSVGVGTPTKYLSTMNAYDYIEYNWGFADAFGSSYRDAWERLWAIGPNKSFTLDGNQVNNPQGIDYYKNVKARDLTRDVYKNSFSHSHQITMSGGSDKTKYLLKFNYGDWTAMKVNNRGNSASANIRVDQKIGKKFNLRMDAGYGEGHYIGGEATTSGAGAGSLGGGSILSTAYYFRPIASNDVQGILDPLINKSLRDYDALLNDRFNPVNRLRDELDESFSRSVGADIRLSWNIIEGMTARSELSLSTGWSKSRLWRGAVYNNYFDAEDNKTFGGNARMETSDSRGLFWSNSVNYKVPGLGKNHNLDAVVGYETRMSAPGQSMTISGEKFPASFTSDRAFGMMNQYDPASPFSLNSWIGYPERLLSFFGRINYGLMDRYLFTVTMRTDASSRFAPTKRWGYFPAGAVAWRVSEESFLKDTRWLDNLKIRLSYGTVGNDGINPDLWKSLWESGGTGNYALNNVRQTYYRPSGSTMKNPTLTWETTITRNLGLDYSVLNSRLYGSVDFYHNTTKDLLLRAQISAISGYNYTYANVGQTSNKGVEITIGGDILRGKDYSLSASGNINFNKNNIDKLNEGVNGLYGTKFSSAALRPAEEYLLKEGHPVGIIRGYQYDGFYTTDDFTYNNGVYTLESINQR